MSEVWVLGCRHFRGYEEVRTPAVKTAGMNAGERLLPIEEMEPWAQSAFKGFKYAASSLLTSVFEYFSQNPSVVMSFHEIS